MISSGGVKIIRTLVKLLQLHTLDRHSGQTICAGCESQGLYYLFVSSTTCSGADSSLMDLINYQLELKYVVLDYHRSQKGYCCYSSTLQRYLISVNVTFFEFVPYFQSNHVTSEPLQKNYSHTSFGKY